MASRLYVVRREVYEGTSRQVGRAAGHALGLRGRSAEAFEARHRRHRVSSAGLEHRLDEIEEGQLPHRKLPLCQLGDRGARVAPATDVDRRLGGVEQVQDLDRTQAGPSRELRRLERDRQGLAGVLLEGEDAEADTSGRLLAQRAGGIGQCRHSAGEHDGLPMTPEVEQGSGPCADRRGEQRRVVEALRQHERHLRPFQRAGVRAGAVEGTGQFAGEVRLHPLVAALPEGLERPLAPLGRFGEPTQTAAEDGNQLRRSARPAAFVSPAAW